VIWIDLDAQSVCTYQLWIFLILRCSTRSEDSRDYTFIIFGHLVQKIWIKQANRRFDSNLRIVSKWTHEIWGFIVLRDSTSFKDSNGISFVIFGPTDQKIWFSEDLDQFWFQNLNRNRFKTGGSRGRFLLARTGSTGSRLWIVGSKVIWTHRISPYLFGLVICSGVLDRDPTAVIEAERCLPGWSRFLSSSVSLRTGGWRRRHLWGSWQPRRSGQWAGRRGEDDGEMAVSKASWNDGEEWPEISGSSALIWCDGFRGF
jgi:hypothetical protein